MRIAFKVGVRQRLFKPRDPQRANGLCKFERRWKRHPLIGVHHHADAIPNRLANAGKPLHVLCDLGRAHLDLHRLEAAPYIPCHFIEQLCLRVGEPSTASIQRNAIMNRTKDSPHGLPKRSCPGVPHRDIDRSARPALQPRLPKVFRLAVVSLQEHSRPAGITSQRDLARVLKRARDRSRAVVKAQQIRPANHSIHQLDARHHKRNVADAVRCIRNGDRSRGTSTVKLNLADGSRWHRKSSH
jgi:hypothetical protein